VALAVAFLAVYQEGPLGAAMATAAILAVLADQLFRRAGLLALVAAWASALWAVAAAARLVQPAAAIRTSGWLTVAVGAAVAAGAAIVARWGSTAPYPAWQPRPPRAERERLAAELEVARQAQLRMLPAAAATSSTSWPCREGAPASWSPTSAARGCPRHW
jgi:hypothetical protein